MLAYWLKNQGSGNFGDMISLILAQLFDRDPEASPNLFFMLGSCLSDDWFQWAIDHPAPVAYFWCCGWRGEPTTLHKHKKIQLCGFRGPKTAAAFGETGFAGDPAYLLPLLIEQPPRAAKPKTILVPHFLEPGLKELYSRRAALGIDEIILPVARDAEDVKRLIETIATADFVLCGSMHAAIVAHAYGVPFAFFDSGSVDCPPKWDDVAAVMNIDTAFAKDLSQGREIWEKGRGQIRKPLLREILANAPAGLKDEFRL
jgi:hypothetical protein